MAKTNEPKPAVGPPPLPETKSSPSDTEIPTAPTTQPEIASSTLPAGVQMHDAGSLPYTADRDKRLATVEPQAPPPGWKGAYKSCGGCGAFLGNDDRCPKCAPAHALPNVVNVKGST